MEVGLTAKEFFPTQDLRRADSSRDGQALGPESTGTEKSDFAKILKDGNPSEKATAKTPSPRSRPSVQSKNQKAKTESTTPARGNIEVSPSHSDRLEFNDAPVSQDDDLLEPSSVEALGEPATDASPIYNKPKFEKISVQQPQISAELAAAPIGGEVLLQSMAKRLAQVGQTPQVNVEPLAHRGAILTFMRKMQNDFNVGPVQMLEAFGKLSSEELEQPPEATIAKVVGELGLDAKQTDQAKTYYSEMLDKLDAHNLADYVALNDKQVSLEVLSQQELRNRKMAESLQTMSQQFFAKPEAVKPLAHPQALAPQDLQAPNTEKTEKTNDSKDLNPFWLLADGAAAGAASVSQGPSAKSLAEASASLKAPASLSAQQLAEMKFELDPDDAGVTEEAPPKLDVAEKLIAAPMAAVTPPQVLDVDAMLAKAKLQSAAPTAAKLDAAPAAAVAVSNGKNADGAKDEKSKGDDSKANMQNQLNTNAQPEVKNQKLHGPETFVVGLEPKAHEQKANLEKISEQTHLLIEKGGGEMKVRLQPEGLGELHIKVAIHEGRVQVEMMADSDHSKKILEKGLADLKSNLASHKIEVGQVKVDVSRDIMQDLANQQQDAERRQAQNFMNQFRDQNQFVREGMLNPAGFKTYPGQRDPGTPDKTATARRNSASARRLDLVA